MRWLRPAAEWMRLAVTRLLVAGGVLVAIAVGVAIATQGTLTVLDGNGTARTYQITINSGGAFLSNQVICDGTAGANCAAVKAGSVQAAAGDPALVVALSPNTPAIGTTLQGALPAGTASIGAVGGITSTITVQPTITAALYTTGQCVGALQSITNAASPRTGSPNSLIVQSLVVGDASLQDVNLDVVFFSALPTTTGLVDHAACNIAAADLLKIAGVMHVTDWTAYSANGSGQAQAQAIPLKLAGTTAYAQAITRGGPTYTGTGNLSFTYGVFQD